jgi:catalase
MMQGFGVNTFTLNKLDGEQCFVKFHWIPELGVNSLTWDEALKISGQDPGEFSTFCLTCYSGIASQMVRLPPERPV